MGVDAALLDALSWLRRTAQARSSEVETVHGAGWASLLPRTEHRGIGLHLHVARLGRDPTTSCGASLRAAPALALRRRIHL